MKDRDELDVNAQVRFGANGEMEKDEEVDTDLSDWGLVDEEVERETKIEQEAASEFGVDDRTEVRKESQTEQDQLVVSRDENQQTLDGKTGGMRVKYGD